MAINKTGLPLSQGDLYLLPLAWQTYANHLRDFADYKSGYTAKLATTQAQALAAAQALPDDAARSAQAEAVWAELLSQVVEYIAAWQRLDGYIEKVFPTTADARRRRHRQL